MPLSAGSFGTILFIVPEILDTEYKEYAEYAEIPRISGYPALHKVGDRLSEFTLSVRLNSHPGIGYNVSAKDKLDLLRAEIGGTTPKALTLNGESFGNFLLKEISWTVKETAGTGKPIKIDAKIVFLENPV